MNKYFIYVFLYIACVSSSPVQAWGALGHQVVCDLAWRHSSAPVQRYLSASAKRMGYRTFAQSCVWADEIKSQSTYDYLKPLHYVNVARSQNTVKGAWCLSRKTPQCVITAIDYYSSQLANNTLRQTTRDQALLLLGHFVADVHQPLHVSYADDRGGNRRHVVFNGKVLSLHRLWDAELLYCQQSSGKRMSWKRLGSQWYQTPLTEVKQLSPSAWADESLEITQHLYAILTQKVLSDTYCDEFYPVAEQRLRLAGRRLATLLAQMLVP